MNKKKKNWFLGTSSIYSSEYQAVLNRATSLGYTLPSAGQRLKEDNLIKARKASGLWALSDVMYNYWSDGSKEYCTLNWKNPLLFQATIIGGMTWTASKGFTGNGTDGYLRFGFIPSVNGVNYTQNAASQITYVPVNEQSIVGDIFQTTAGSTIKDEFFPRYSDNHTYYGINDANEQDGGIFGTSLSHWAVIRKAAAVVNVFKAGSLAHASTPVSTGVPPVEACQFTNNLNNVFGGAFASHSRSMFILGGDVSGVIAQESTDWTTFIS